MALLTRTDSPRPNLFFWPHMELKNSLELGIYHILWICKHIHSNLWQIQISQNWIKSSIFPRKPSSVWKKLRESEKRDKEGRKQAEERQQAEEGEEEEEEEAVRKAVTLRVRHQGMVLLLILLWSEHSLHDDWRKCGCRNDVQTVLKVVYTRTRDAVRKS